MSDRRVVRHEQTKAEILRAAWALAEDRGLAGLSLRDLAATVGMQAPSLYTYFSGKDTLFDAMFAAGYRALDERGEQWRRDTAGMDPSEALGVVARRFVEFCQESPARYQLMFTRAIPGWEPSPEAYSVSLRLFERLVELVASLGIDRPEDHDLFTAIVSGLAAQQMANDPDGDRWARLAPSAMEMMVRWIERSER